MSAGCVRLRSDIQTRDEVLLFGLCGSSWAVNFSFLRVNFWNELFKIASELLIFDAISPQSIFQLREGVLQLVGRELYCEDSLLPLRQQSHLTAASVSTE